MPNLPALDGLRAIAVILVMFFHSRAPFLKQGLIGVDVFFVISGFLITCLLRKELQQRADIKLRSFYWRRFLRLTPPLILLLVLYTLLAPRFWPWYDGHYRDVLLAASYLSDYSKALYDVPRMLSHTWSLAVEEHFYLIWPLLLLATRGVSSRSLLLGLIVLYVLGTYWRFWCFENQPWKLAYYRFDSRFTGLVLGAVIAIANGFQPPSGRVRLFALLALVPLVIAVGLLPDKTLLLQLGVTLVELASAAAILLALGGGAFSRLLGWAPLRYLGLWSYGIYLFHFPIFMYLRKAYGWQSALTVGTLITLLLAMTSYYTLEAWARKLRRKEGWKSGPKGTEAIGFANVSEPPQEISRD
ncbi:acyltransferase family protein [Pseudomonas denitrificans (nom. rej.)]|uniref:Acyltransferase n=1 Tax=Pseudomonas denitrificans TaxID=43306 RepID=A0A9X7N247_PSEDE|nr:acyltransferase [Pseudomonas denitrificans (nom. rej.)]QEY73560.1 acyltransferase [Pseudomonas denitrificans (nom. rej.)]